MTKNALAIRDDRATDLSVFQVNPGDYIVESSKRKICYKVSAINGSKSCTCADFISNFKGDDEFVCKHILAAVNANGNSIQVNKTWKPKLDDRFITDFKGKDFVVYSGLLDLAHQKGLQRVIVEILQYPTKDNGHEAICRAILESYNGERFIEIGDASPKNVNKMISSHIIRMAATRAKARAMRDFTNIGMTCLEELGDDVIDIGTSSRSSKAAGKPATSGKKAGTQSGKKTESKPDESKPVEKTETKSGKPVDQKAETKSADKSENKKASTKGNGPTLSNAQRNAILNLGGRRGISEDDLEAKAVDAYGCSVESLSPHDASSLIRELQQT